MYQEQKMEKITVNLPPGELARMDILVEAGLYPSRTELIRVGIGKTLDSHQDFIDERISQLREDADMEKKELSSEDLLTNMFFMGVGHLDVKTFEKAIAKKKKIRVVAFGILSIDTAVTVEQIEQTVAKIRVYGVLKASPQVKIALSRKK